MQQRPDCPGAFELQAWLIAASASHARFETLLAALGGRLRASGVALGRISVHTRTLNPQVFAVGFTWQVGQEPRALPQPHGVLVHPAYLSSPLLPVFERGEEVRRSIETADRSEFPILGDLAGEGFTDYLALPMRFSDGSLHAITWAGDRPGGFTEREVALFRDLDPCLATVLEARLARRTAKVLLDTYLGADAGGRVLAGTITRGGGERIRAVICAADMRGFTGLSDRLGAADTLALLNGFFERTVTPIAARGGQVLKFIGDGFLAVYPLNGEPAARRAADALDAALEGMEAVEAWNRERAPAGHAAVRFGLALHEGEVAYGNIGTVDRLDFTVIGPAVNLTARLEGLTKRLGRMPLLSADFAALCDRPLESLGFHPIRGLGEPVEVFAPPAPS